jgi:hypothetical protein
MEPPKIKIRRVRASAGRFSSRDRETVPIMCWKQGISEPVLTPWRKEESLTPLGVETIFVCGTVRSAVTLLSATQGLKRYLYIPC